MSEAFRTSINSLPTELLSAVLKFADTPSPFPANSFSSYDGQKLKQERQRIECHTAIMLVCKHWSAILGPQTKFLAIGRKRLRRFFDAMDSGLVDEKSVKSLRLETYEETEYSLDGVDKEDLSRIHLCIAILKRCVALEELALHVADYRSEDELDVLHRQMGALKSLKGLKIDAPDIPMPLDCRLKHLAGLDTLRVSAFLLSLSSDITLSFKELTILDLSLPQNEEGFRKLLAASHNSLTTLHLPDCSLRGEASYASLNRLLEPLTQLRELSCRTLVGSVPDSVQFFEPSQMWFTSVRSLTLQSPTLKSFELLSQLPALRSLTSHRPASWTYHDLITTLLQLPQPVAVEIKVLNVDAEVMLLEAYLLALAEESGEPLVGERRTKLEVWIVFVVQHDPIWGFRYFEEVKREKLFAPGKRRVENQKVSATFGVV